MILMAQQIDLNEINKRINLMRQTAEELKALGQNFPALARNTSRILASIKMLEMNVSDPFEMETDD